MNIQELNQINENEWEIPQTYRYDMRVPVRIFASRALLEQVMDDKSLEQAVNAATLPGLVGAVVVMPDMHQGYGFPIGGVAATEYPSGVISPGAIGYDINCGVRLLASNIEYEVRQAGPEPAGDPAGPALPVRGGQGRRDQGQPERTGRSATRRLTLGAQKWICDGSGSGADRGNGFHERGRSRFRVRARQAAGTGADRFGGRRQSLRGSGSRRADLRRASGSRDGAAARAC